MPLKLFSPLSVVLLLLAMAQAVPSFSQSGPGYSFIINCFKNPSIDSFETEIEGLGEVISVNYGSDSAIFALSYFVVPHSKQSKPGAKTAQLAANSHISTWKNNSRIMLHEKHKDGSATIIDLRLHMLIENFFMQVIIISENNRVYQLTTITEDDNKEFFDNLLKQIRAKQCVY